MRVSEWEDYIRKVLTHVKFKYDHNGIYFELLQHMEDRYEDFLTEGMEEERAKEAVLLCMGDADEIGEALNSTHNPLLGWVWLILKRMILVLIVLQILPILGILISMPQGIFDRYHTYEESPLVYTIEVDHKEKLYNETLFIKEIRYYEDERLDILYATWQNPFSNDIQWSFGISARVFDKNGERIVQRGSGWKSAGYYSKGQQSLKNVPVDAEKLVVYYGQGEELTINLREGREEGQ